MRAGLLTLEQLREVPLVRTQIDAVQAKYPGLQERRLIHETVRRMINHLVVDVVQHSSQRIAAARPAHIDDVRAQSGLLIAMSEPVQAQHLQLKAFLRDNLYRHYRVQRMTLKARGVVRALIEVFMSDVRLMPDDYQSAARLLESQNGLAGRARAVADYVAGMTDRYAILEHERMFVPGERS